MPEKLSFAPPEAVESGENKKESQGILTGIRKKIGLEAAAVMSAAALAACDTKENVEKVLEPVAELHFREDIPDSSFDNMPDYFVRHPNGEYSKEERQKITENVARGVTVMHDVGLDFYKVQKGETIWSIRQKLSSLPQYRYLNNQYQKLDSFNIPARELRAGMWLPIPLETRDRLLSDEQFAKYVYEALEEMRSDIAYGESVERLLEEVGEPELIASMIAVAKQEGGGRPLGQFELHRWEKGHDRFSFSMFHVLMKGPGLNARKRLEMTEGQLYHPKNGAKLFMGFMIEKAREQRIRPESILPLEGPNLASFAVFYNGKKWKKKNPHYVTNVGGYYNNAMKIMDALLEGDDLPKSATTIKPPKDNGPKPARTITRPRRDQRPRRRGR